MTDSPVNWSRLGTKGELGWTTAATAARSLQSCPTLCDPIDRSPPGSPVPGILQARTLEWVAISFSNAWKWKVKVKSLSRVRPSATPWTAADQAPPSMGFSRQEHWSGWPLPSPRMNHSLTQNHFSKRITLSSVCLYMHIHRHTHTQIYTHKTQKTKKRYQNFRWYDFNFSSSYFCFLNSPITTLKKSKTDEKETHNYIHTIMILKTSSSESFSSSAYSFQQIFIECLLNKLWDVPVVPVGCYILCDFIWTSLIEGALISYLCSPVHPQIWYKIFFIPHSLTEHQPCVSHYPGQALKGNVIENQHHT